MLIQESQEGSSSPSHPYQPNKTKPEVLQADPSSLGCSPEQSQPLWLCQPLHCQLGLPCTCVDNDYPPGRTLALFRDQ